MSNVIYSFSKSGLIGIGKLCDGTEFIFDSVDFEKIKEINWYRNKANTGCRQLYIIDRKGTPIHRVLFPNVKKGCEIDHINLNTLDNRRCNLRICTHQQNQINQPPQKNNTSGVVGVSWHSPRKKFRARIKIGQHDIHLGYYKTFQEAVQARNVGMMCMFGEYGRYNKVPCAPEWIRKQVIEQCRRFAELSVCKAFLLSNEVAVDE